MRSVIFLIQEDVNIKSKFFFAELNCYYVSFTHIKVNCLVITQGHIIRGQALSEK